MNFRFFKVIVSSSFTLKLFQILICFFLLLAGFQQAYSFDGSRFFTGLMFFSGLGSSFAGAIIQGQANKTYDEYMHTAGQSNMDKIIDDYKQKRQQSIIASKAGLGLAIGAILISFIDAAHISQPEAQKASDTFGYIEAKPSSFSKACSDNGVLFTMTGKF